MNMVEVNGVKYVLSNEEVATFLNQEVYSDMIWSGEMDAITPADDVFALLCEAISDEPMLAKNFIISLEK